MKIKRKKIVAVLSIVCAFSIMTAGCGVDSAQNVEADAEVYEMGDEATVQSGAKGGIDAALDGTSQDSEGRWHVLEPDVAKVVDADFEGTVKRIDSDSLYIVELQTEIMEDGAMVVVDVSTETQVPDSDLIQVVFEESARFYIRTIYDNGARYEDSEAGFKDLEQNMSVALKGEFIGDVFHAREIRMNKVA